jgi:transcriptional regulator with XRE-family HTH domain
MSQSEDQPTLAKLRQRAGLTQRQLAEALSITVKTVSAWERGIGEPHLTIGETQRLMAILQCSFSELVEATKPQK